MRTKDLCKLNYRLLNQLADELKKFVKEHQGEQGFIDLRLQDEEENENAYDNIISIAYLGAYETPLEVVIKAIRYNAKLDVLEVLYDTYCENVKVVWSLDDIKSAENDEDLEWESLNHSEFLDYTKTIFAITEFINEYV